VGEVVTYRGDGVAAREGRGNIVLRPGLSDLDAHVNAMRALDDPNKREDRVLRDAGRTTRLRGLNDRRRVRMAIRSTQA
jgi:hypothetical protein